MIKKKGLLLVISGPSGAGKGTVCKELLKRNPDFKLSVSATTRAPREGEVDGESYYFLTKEKFNEMIGQGGFLEYAQIYSNFYGTPKGPVMKYLEEGKDVILEIEMQGARQVKEMYPDDFAIYSGNDDSITPLLSLGGSGVISVLANVCPRQTHDLVAKFLD